MFLWAGLHQACIRNHSGAVKDLKFGRNERIYVYFEVIMFFRKDPPQTEGRRHADAGSRNQNAAGKRKPTTDHAAWLEAHRVMNVVKL